MDESVKPAILTDEEQRFIEAYRQLDDAEKEKIRQKIFSDDDSE